MWIKFLKFPQLWKLWSQKYYSILFHSLPLQNGAQASNSQGWQLLGQKWRFLPEKKCDQRKDYLQTITYFFRVHVRKTTRRITILLCKIAGQHPMTLFLILYQFYFSIWKHKLTHWLFILHWLLKKGKGFDSASGIDLVGWALCST